MLTSFSVQYFEVLNTERPLTPQSGELYERTFETSKGPVDVLAEIVIAGETILLKDIVVYGRSAQPLTGLTTEVIAARRALIEDAKSLGFKKLRITGRRVKSSSSARPGKMIDLTIDLTRE